MNPSDIKGLIERAQIEIEAVDSFPQLAEMKAKLLGKKSELTALSQTLKSLSVEEKKTLGQTLNQMRQAIETLFLVKKQLLEDQKLEATLKASAIDATLSLEPLKGSYHPIRLIKRRVESILVQAGFEVTQGPEIETDYYNFEALNFPHNHPARSDQDTFYTVDGRLLRTHTSSVQIRRLEDNSNLPVKIISVGRVYRSDYDATHTPMFHQVEGLYIGRNVSFVQLNQTLQLFLSAFFDCSIEMRMRPSFFPFTEPSVEVDIRCIFCDEAVDSCSVCKTSRWIEVLGAGMVHPNVLDNLGIDSVQYNGFAFGIGLERLCALYFGLNDIRLLYDNDLDFLNQFLVG